MAGLTRLIKVQWHEVWATIHLQTTSGTLQGLDGRGSSDLVQGSASVLDSVTVQLHQLGQVELGLLQDLYFSNEHILQREDSLALLLDFKTDRIGGRNTKNRTDKTKKQTNNRASHTTYKATAKIFTI